MNIQEYFDFITHQIHSVVLATVDRNGGLSPVPSTSWIMMKAVSTF